MLLKSIFKKHSLKKSEVENMSVLSVLIKDLVERTTLADDTCFIAGSVDANKITFSNLVAAIKGKFGAAAQKDVANNLTTDSAGSAVLDAYQGKVLKEQIDQLNSTLLKKVMWTSDSFSIPTGEGKNFASTFMPTLSGYTAIACLGGWPNGTVRVVCHPNGWVYNAGSKTETLTVTYQWLFMKNL